jgi:hypothetical protein
MIELLKTAPPVLIIVLAVTTLATLAGFGHLLWLWKKSGKK